VMTAHPEDVVAKTGRAETLRALGRLPEALTAYDDAIVAHPENVVAKTGRAETLRALGRLPEALAAYDDAIATHPEDVVAKSGRAETLRALGRLPEALAAYDEVVAAHPRNEVARNGRSGILVALRRYDEALEHLPSESPTTLEEWIGYHIRGMIFLRTGKIEEAFRVFQRGVSENPWPASREYFRTALAVACLRRRDFREAGRILDEVTAPLLQPQANVLRLHSFGASGDTARALTAYQNLANKPWYISDELVEDLHRQHILKEQPRHDDTWISDQEEIINLLVANQQSFASSSFSAYY
jgi:tetratricopeptide (TPR) repeat protein